MVVQMIPRNLALRFLYDYGTPTITSTGLWKRGLDVLVADQTLGAANSERLARIQLLNWYFADLGFDDLKVTLFVPGQAVTAIAMLESLSVEFSKIAAFDESDADEVARIAKRYDCDVVLSSDEKRLHPAITDDSALVTSTVAGVLREAELHAKGFNAPWSFEGAVRFQPWMQFYAMSEHSIFRDILHEWEQSKKASPETAEAMRLLVLNLKTLCFSRDRMAFYRQQDRWAHRAGFERQDFRFEYTAYLNQFYVNLYTAFDQTATLIVRAYNLPIPDSQIGVLKSSFQRAIKQSAPEIYTLFKEDAFWDRYGLLRDMRHTSVHRELLTQQVIYTDDNDFSDEEIDAKAVELGYFNDADYFTGEMRDYLIAMARYKAKLALLGSPMKHVVLVQHEDGSGTFYNPDPHADLERFLEFFRRTLDAIKPWERRRIPTDEALIARWKPDIETIGMEINSAWTVWEHFKVVHAAGMSNTRVVDHPASIYMFVFIAKAVVESVMMAVRRQIDSDVRSVSLLNFLTELKLNPTTYSLEKCVETFKTRALLVRHKGQERYEREAAAAFAAIADASGTHMSSEKIGADIKALKKACNALVNITNQYVAHRNRTDKYPELPEQQIEENVNLVYALTRKYGRLFDAFGVGPNGIDADGMRSLFSFAWVPAMTHAVSCG
jgi:hypothetical protein